MDQVACVLVPKEAGPLQGPVRKLLDDLSFPDLIFDPYVQKGAALFYFD